MQLLADEFRQEAERRREEAEQAKTMPQDLKADEEARLEQIAGLEAQNCSPLGTRKDAIEDECQGEEAYLDKADPRAAGGSHR